MYFGYDEMPGAFVCGPWYLSYLSCLYFLFHVTALVSHYYICYIV
jgi:hypothetical protein